MDWSATGALLIAIRAIHFAATAIAAGTLVFRAAIARPVLRADEAAAKSFRTQTLWVVSVGVVVAIVSGAVWLLLQSVSMSGLPFGEAVTADLLSTVLSETQFGQVTLIRLALAVVAVSLAFGRSMTAERLALAAAAGFAASLAWTGHAASTLGATGYMHLAADALHLLAAAAWIGGLVSLVLLLFAAARNQPAAWAPFARDATERFSSLGMVSVATLIVTGVVNGWILVGSFRGLLATEYGRVLMLKLGIFAAMLAVAAINRFYLMPRLALPSANGVRLDALGQIMRNSVIEIALGLAILAIVGMLGMMHPAIHLVST